MSNWYAEIARRINRFQHVFWFVPESQRSLNFDADLTDVLTHNGSVSWISCNDLPLTSKCDLDVGAIDFDARCVVVANFDHLIDIKSGPLWMQQLRPECMRALESGHRLLVISRRLQDEFPTTNGSSLALDTTAFTIDPDRHIVDDDLKVALARGYGLISVASNMVAKDSTTSAEKKALLNSCLSAAISQCRSTTLSWLMANAAHAGMASCKDESWDDIPDDTLEDLRAIGLAKWNPQTDEVVVGRGIPKDQLRKTIVQADLQIAAPPADWEAIAGGLFRIERNTRRVVESFLEVHSHLGDAPFDRYSEKASKNFRDETGFKLKNPPNPLQWIDFSDVIDIAIDLSHGRNVGVGMNKREWEKLRQNVVPVRNRVMHCRLPREGDLATVREWRGKLRRAVG